MKVHVEHKGITFHYEIIDTYTAGIVLTGQEVKALKTGLGSLKEAFLAFSDGHLSLVKSHIPPYQPKNAGAGYDPYHARKILVTKKQLKELTQKKLHEGLTLVPIKLYNKGNLIKLDFALARGKKLHDKRQTIKKREDERSIRRLLKNKR